MSGFANFAQLQAALNDLPDPNQDTIEGATFRQLDIARYTGSLGRLKEIAIFMAGWQSLEVPKLDRMQSIVFIGDHGAAKHLTISETPMKIAQKIEGYRNGKAATSSLAAAGGAELSVIDMCGNDRTGDISEGPAMSDTECLAAISSGANAVKQDMNLLTLGTLGTGSKISASAICAQVFGEGAGLWVSRRNGLDARQVVERRKIVDSALSLHGTSCDSPFDTLWRLGGREIAAVAGAILAARLYGIPVILDGFACCAAVALMSRANPKFGDHCLVAGCSEEPAHRVLLSRLNMHPLIDLDIELGEGTGAAVAAEIVRAALVAHNGVLNPA